MKLSVLVPTLGTRKKEIERLFRSLEDQTYKDFEIIVVTQSNHGIVKEIISHYENLCIKQVEMNRKGLSRARNRGLEQVSGEIILLSDDDCWYPNQALERIAQAFLKNPGLKIVLSQIFDPEQNVPYKNYRSNKGYIENRFRLMSVSSIEIAFRKAFFSEKAFDEHFGLGSEFVCGEEVDFLLNNYAKNTIFYMPEVTVYHRKKERQSAPDQIVAKGALYGKHFSMFVSLLILCRDAIVKGENNFRPFFRGRHEYLKRKN